MERGLDWKAVFDLLKDQQAQHVLEWRVSGSAHALPIQSRTGE